MNKKIYLTAACALFVSIGAMAQTKSGRSAIVKPRAVTDRSELKPHVGLLAGAISPEGAGTVQPEYGVDIGYQPYIPFGLGLEYTHSRLDNNISKSDRDAVLAKATYNFGGDMTFIRDTYVGVAMGAVFTPSQTAFVGAPLAGFDIPITGVRNMDNQTALTVGAVAKYSIVGNNELDALSVNGAVKYWY